MKKLLLFIAAGMLISFAANAYPSKAKFIADGPKKIRVFVDNRLVNKRPTDVVHLDYLMPGRHNVRVEVFGRRGRAIFDDVIFVRKGFESHFSVSRKYGNFGLVHTHKRPLNYNRFPDYGPYGPVVANHKVLTEREFNGLQKRLRAAHFDGDKIQIIKRSLRYRKLYSEDVLHLMDHLVYESSRLKLAKFAYHKTWDKENYLIVSDGLRFASSRRNLDRYLYQFPM